MRREGGRVPAVAAGGLASRQPRRLRQPRVSGNARIWLQMHSPDPETRKKAWKKYQRALQRASATGSSHQRQNPAAAAATPTSPPAGAEDELDYGDEDYDDEAESLADGYQPSEAGGLADEGEAPASPAQDVQEDPAEEPGSDEPAAEPNSGGEAPSGQEAHHQARGVELASEYDALSALHASGQLSTETFYQLSRPLLESAVEHFRLGMGEFPGTLGSDPVWLRMFDRLQGQLDVTNMRLRRAGVGSAIHSTPVGAGYATAIGAPLPRPAAAGLDPAVSTKPSLLKPPKFWEGDSDGPIRGWLTSVAHWLTMNKVPRQDAVGTAANYLRGKAQAYWFSMVDSLRGAGKDPTSWDVFRDTMVLAYGAIDPEYVARTKIDALRQTGSVESYVRDMQLLFAELIHNPMNEADKVHKFFTGLNPALAMRTQVDPATSERWTTFAAAAQFVIKQDILWQASKVLTKSAKSPPAPPAAGCTGEIRGGGIHRQPFKRQGRRPGKNNGKTSGNGGSGTVGAGGSGGAGTSTARRPSKEQRELWFKEGKCLLCGHPDHKKAECPKAKRG